MDLKCSGCTLTAIFVWSNTLFSDFFVFHGCIYRPKHALVPIVRDYLGYMITSTSKPYVTIMYCQGGSIHSELYQSVAVPSMDLKTSNAMWVWKWFILSLHLYMIANHCNNLLSPVCTCILEVFITNDNNPVSSNIYFISSNLGTKALFNIFYITITMPQQHVCTAFVNFGACLRLLCILNYMFNIDVSFAKVVLKCTCINMFEPCITYIKEIFIIVIFHFHCLIAIKWKLLCFIIF